MFVAATVAPVAAAMRAGAGVTAPRGIPSRLLRREDARLLQMRFEVLQRFNENTRFKKLKAEGLGNWSSSGSTATVYQRDLTLTNIEAAATYKARVSFRWTAPDGSIEWRRVLVSNPCKQRHTLPKLKLTNVTAVPIVGRPTAQTLSAVVLTDDAPARTTG